VKAVGTDRTTEPKIGFVLSNSISGIRGRRSNLTRLNRTLPNWLRFSDSRTGPSRCRAKHDASRALTLNRGYFQIPIGAVPVLGPNNTLPTCHPPQNWLRFVKLVQRRRAQATRKTRRTRTRLPNPVTRFPEKSLPSLSAASRGSCRYCGRPDQPGSRTLGAILKPGTGRPRRSFQRPAPSARYSIMAVYRGIGGRLGRFFTE